MTMPFAKLFAGWRSRCARWYRLLPGSGRWWVGSRSPQHWRPTPTSAASQGPLLSLVLFRLWRSGPFAASNVSPIPDLAETGGYLIMVLAEAPHRRPDRAGDPLRDRSETVRTAALSALRSFPPSAPARTQQSAHRPYRQGDERRSYAIEALVELRETVNCAGADLDASVRCRPRLRRNGSAGAGDPDCKQDFGESRRRWNAWWQKHRVRAAAELAARAVCRMRISTGCALAQDELTQLWVTSLATDRTAKARARAGRKRWTEWWQRRGYAGRIAPRPPAPDVRGHSLCDAFDSLRQLSISITVPRLGTAAQGQTGTRATSQGGVPCRSKFDFSLLAIFRPWHLESPLAVSIKMIEKPTEQLASLVRNLSCLTLIFGVLEPSSAFSTTVSAIEKSSRRCAGLS